MGGRHLEAWMDGVALSSVGAIILSEFYDDAPTLEITAAPIPGRYGQRMTARNRTELTVSLAVYVRNLHDLPTRTRTVEALAKWASGSILEVNSRPGRRLHVTGTSIPAVGATRNYAQEIRMEFTAYEIPYWEDVMEAQGSATGTTDDITLFVDGTAPDTPLLVTVTPSAAALTSCTLAIAGGDAIALTGINIAAGSSLVIGVDEADRMKAMSGTTSLLRYRTGADALRVKCGQTSTLSFETNTSCAVTVAARGRWL